MKLIIKKNPLTKVFGLYLTDPSIRGGLALRFGSYLDMKGYQKSWDYHTLRTMEDETAYYKTRLQRHFPNEPLWIDLGVS